MMAVGGSETWFEQGRVQLELLAGLQVTTQAVERQAETISRRRDMAAQEQAAIEPGGPAESSAVEGPEIPVLYLEREGRGAPRVSSQTEGRAGKQGEPGRPREVKLGCVFTQTTLDGRRRPVRDEASTPYTGGIETAQAFGRRMSVEA